MTNQDAGHRGGFVDDPPHQELLDLIDALCDDAIGDEQGCRLAELLRTDARARAIYVDYVGLRLNLDDLDLSPPNEDLRLDDCLHLRALLAEDDAPRSGPDFAGVPPTFNSQSAAQSGHGRFFPGSLASVFPASWASPGAAGAIICLLAVVGVSGAMLFGRRAPSGADGLGSAAPRNGEVVARISGTKDCLWADSSDRVGYTSPLYAGQQLRLLKGLVEIAFTDGTKVILEGPASFVVASHVDSVLNAGRLTATVPDHAEGFTVIAPGMHVTHQGTVFGVYSDESGSTEVHVFDGRVDAELLGPSGEIVRTLHLAANQAARLQNPHMMITQLVADSEGFVRSLAPSSGPHSGMLAFEGFHYSTGPLAGQNGGFGWGGAWGDISLGDGTLADRGDTNRVVAENLKFGDVESTGNHAVQTGQKNRIRRTLAASVRGIFDIAGLVEDQDGMRLVGKDGTTVYLSFLQRVSATNDVFYGLEVHRGDGNANRVLSIGHGADETGYGMSSRYNGVGGSTFRSLGTETTETNFFVVKFTFGINNLDVVEVWRNPKSLIREEANTIDARLEGNLAFDRIGLGNFGGTKTHEVDRICVGVSFAAVTGHWREAANRVANRPSLPVRTRIVQRIGRPSESEVVSSDALWPQSSGD